MPDVKWEERMVTIPEGGDREVCFTSNIGTARSYDITVGVSGKGGAPATSGKQNLFLPMIRL